MFGIRKVACLVAIIASTSLAQTGAIPVDIKGRILDLTDYPPAEPIDRSEPFDTGSLKGAQVAFDLDSGNVVFFSTNPKSAFFTTYAMPGAAGTVNSVKYPASAYYFFSSVNDLGDGSGLVASNLFQPSGVLTVHEGSAATGSIPYAGSQDNPLWFDRTANLCPNDGECNPAEMTAPMYSWADLLGGDANGCAALAPGAIPKGRFIVITKRFGCDWLQRVRNIVSSGAIGWIIYDDVDTEDLPPLDTPNISIPVFFIRNRDGAAVLDQLRTSVGITWATLHPRNLTASISGTYTVDSAGTLRGVNLNLVVSTQFDTVFTGTVTTPQGATNLSREGAAGGINLMVPGTWSRTMPPRPRSHSGTAGRSGKPALP